MTAEVETPTEVAPPLATVDATSPTAVATSPRSTLLDRPLLVIALVVAAALPWVAPSPYWIDLFGLICIFAIVNQSWNLIMGYAGIWSFGQLAFFGVGGYTSVLLAYHYGVSPFLGTIAGALLAVVASLILGVPSLRLKGAYVVLLTLAFHEILRNMIQTDTTKWSGGGFGLFGYGQYGVENLKQFERVTILYYAALVMLILTNLAIWRVLHSPLGLAFRALRDAEPYAVSRGIGEYRFKLLVFAISAFFTGFAGAFYAHYIHAIAPSSVFDFGLMMILLAMIVIGGWGTFWGPVIGTIVIRLLDERLRDFNEWRLLILGALMVAFVILLPEGLVSPLGRVKDWIAGRLDGRRHVATKVRSQESGE